MTTVMLVPMFVALGMAAGALHFASLARGTRELVCGESAWAPIALLLLRFVVTGTLLYVAARLGALALIAALAGWLVARSWRLHAEAVQ
ncbi:MAG: N-ATPase, AtpR subunit [Hydrocarboniphaga sp.]|uniref:N-ATPase subunit AtpR n=1 Tax=Hydrocarboniphaga sp. TaxID=2033016 RepID=UPI002631A0D4|nr:ATP synthase subunit I [Hydrocarboniphaga sp.]MDB5972263.1 N-ATPase, AtpR subunit [Hydrocarboniphaga sp.]